MTREHLERFLDVGRTGRQVERGSSGRELVDEGRASPPAWVATRVARPLVAPASAIESSSSAWAVRTRRPPGASSTNSRRYRLLSQS